MSKTRGDLLIAAIILAGIAYRTTVEIGKGTPPVRALLISTVLYVAVGLITAALCLRLHPGPKDGEDDQ